MKTSCIHPLKFLVLLVLLGLAWLGQAGRASSANAAQTRELRIVNSSALVGQTVSVAVELVAQGDENALGFSLNYNAAIFSNPVIRLGSGITGATLNANTAQAANGRVGVAIALAAAQTIAAGTRQVAVVTFNVAAGAAGGPSVITFGDQPVFVEVSDAAANSLSVALTPGTVAVQQPNQPPTIINLNPTMAAAGANGLTLQVNGANFVGGAVVNWNGSPRPTTFISSLQLTATITAADLAIPGTASVTVINPAPSGLSNQAIFTITAPPNPTPAITTLSPNAANVGGAGLTLTINGTSFVSGAVVQVNGQNRTTTFVSDTQLTAALMASDLAAPGTLSVTVVNPAPGGGASNAALFTVNAQPNPTPTITTLTPSAVFAGSSAFTLTINGTNFIGGATVQVNGQNRPTTFISATQLTVQITAAEVAAAGTINLAVVNPAPGGGQSNVVQFAINQIPVAQISIEPANPTVNDNVVIRLSGVWPDSCVPMNPQLTANGFELTINTANPNPACLTVLTPWSLNVAVGRLPAGIYTVRVRHTAPDRQFDLGQTSFTVNQPTPTITSLSPAVVNATSAGFTLTINGTNFVNGATVQVNGQNRSTTFVSATQLTVMIPASDLATPGLLNITVTNPAPGGGTSMATTLVITQPPLAQITVLPPNPNANDNITIQLSGTWPNACIPLNPRLTSNGNELLIETSNPGELCGPAVTPWSLSVPAAQLAAGAYNVRVTYSSPSAPSGPFEIGRLTFTVGAAVPTVASVSAASFALSGELSSESIVAAFGANLATGTESATVLPLPTELAGTRVIVRDSAGVERPAALFFVSPLQINYLLPANLANGPATVTVTSGGNQVALGRPQIAAVAPGLFTVNANGQGVAAGVVLRIKADGTQSFESLARFDQTTNRFVAEPIDLGPEGEQVIPILFGTGFRNRSSLLGVNVQIGGTNVAATYAGPAPGFAGLDQINLAPLPRSLVGRGEVDVVVTVDGKAANTVRMSIR